MIIKYSVGGADEQKTMRGNGNKKRKEKGKTDGRALATQRKVDLDGQLVFACDMIYALFIIHPKKRKDEEARLHQLARNHHSFFSFFFVFLQ